STAVSVVAATRFTVVPTTASPLSGAPFDVTVTALDDSSNLAPGYTGTVRLTSTDARSALPADYTFTNSDGGRHTFPGFVRRSAGPKPLTATDPAQPSLTGTAALDVQGAVRFQVVPSVGSVQAGVPFSVTVTALDASGNPMAAYAGTVRLSSTDPLARLPG